MSSSSSSAPLDTGSDLLFHINAGRTRQSLRTLNNHLEESFQSFRGNWTPLLQVAQDPLSISKTKTTLKLCSKSQPPPNSGDYVQYYLRLYSVPRTVLLQYRDSYSADKEWAQAILDKSPDKTLLIPYVGMAYRSTAQGRAKDDQEDPKWSRLKNLLSLLPSRDRNPKKIYELHRHLVNQETDVRALSIYDEIEQNLIATVFPYCLNSASGGYFYRWTPSKDLESLLAKAAPLAVIKPVTSPAHTDLKNSIKEQQQFNHAVFSKLVDPKSLVTDTALDEIIGDTQNIQTCKDRGRVLSVLISKDIPLEAMKGGFAYNSLTAGRAPRAEHHIRSHLIPGLSIPRLDFWQFTEVHQDVAVAAALLCQNLQLLRPILAVSHSSKVANILQSDMLAQVTGASEVLSDINGTMLDDPDIIKSLRDDTFEWDELRHPAFMDVIGTLSIIRYGPGAQDYALHLPERDPGNIAYDPSLAPLYCELHYLCKAKYITACHAILDWKGLLGSLDDLKEIRQFIEDEWKKPGSAGSPSLHELFEEKRKEVAACQLALVSSRQYASKARNAEKEFHTKGYPLRDMTVALGAPVPDTMLQANVELVPSDLSPQFNARIEQWNEYRTFLKDRQDRGIYHLKSFCPSTVEACSTEHRDWFVKVPEGKYLSMSARSYGTQHFVNNPDALQDFITRNKRFGVERSGFSLDSIKCAVANMDQYCRDQYNTSYYFHATCRGCDREEIGGLETTHHCHETTGEKAKLIDICDLKPLYYAHNIFDLLSDKDHDHVTAAGGWKLEMASNIVVGCPWIPNRIKIMAAPSNDYTDDTSPEFLIIMALDRYLETHVRCSFKVDSDSRPNDTRWVNSYKIDFMIKYITHEWRSQWPIILAKCDSKKFNSLSFYVQID
ncbi:hypothetical protein EMPS_02793 [Entomortierella parvispora]|uniref:Uncharacterized protein n=1 Tax=Entomortierella parvispora TaxID=205924 RepID=A0A9P3H5L1_9FUNG|nr:hypothetical protein EMPS_02793 [Entomortierella parvispora]